MERKIKFAQGEYYHVYNRGIARMPVYYSGSDYERFINLLYLCNSTQPVVYKLIQGDPLDKLVEGERIVDVIAFALMPNHYHLLLKERVEGGIVKFLSKIMTAYTMYFNTKHERGGQLFCKPFRSKHIGDDAYFRWVFSYIHLNPLDLIDDEKRNKVFSEKFIREYQYSSYIDYFGKERKESKILSMNDEALHSIEDLNDIHVMEEVVSVDT